MIPAAFRYWKDKFGCHEYTEQRLEFPAVPAGTKLEALYALAPGTVTVTLPGLTPAEARNLINNALWDWRFRRPVDGYVEGRYAHMSQAFRDKRQALFERELAALDQCETDILNF